LSFQEVRAVLGGAQRCLQQTAINDHVVHCFNGSKGVFAARIRDISGVRGWRAVVDGLRCANRNLDYFAKLAEEFNSVIRRNCCFKYIKKYYFFRSSGSAIR
jgi:hypothetical protein